VIKEENSNNTPNSSNNMSKTGIVNINEFAIPESSSYNTRDSKIE